MNNNLESNIKLRKEILTKINQIEEKLRLNPNPEIENILKQINQLMKDNNNETPSIKKK